MVDTSYVTVWNTECILVEESDGLYLIPKEKDDIQKIRPYFDDQEFVLRYSGKIGYDSIAFVERVQHQMNHTIKIFPKYIINRCHIESFSGFEMTGEAIDDFFSPVRYFYDRPKADEKIKADFFYNHEVADEWVISFEGKSLTITLSYGDILSHGIASDLKLHPKLTVEFEQTTDTLFVYRVYSCIVRFLRVIRYDTNCGKLSVELFDRTGGRFSYNGKLRDFAIGQDLFYKGIHEVEYSCYRPYIQRFLQFAADNTQYTFYHYPTEGLRFRGIHYSAVDYMNIFAAFEAECHANEDLYENADATKVQSIKDTLVEQIKTYPRDGLKKEETDFIRNARDRIMQLGTQYGQQKKITNAYGVLHKALDGSIENIFYLPEFRLNGPLKSKDLKKIAEFLAGQRGAVAHGGFSGVFTDADAQKIHFLEILTYAQLVKRAGLDDCDIERVIGAVFGCNHVLFQERYC